MKKKTKNSKPPKRSLSKNINKVLTAPAVVLLCLAVAALAFKL